MGPKTLKTSLLTGIALIVVASGLAIALLVTHRFSSAFHQAMAQQSASLAHAAALEAADRILINDLVGLQKLLDQQKASNPHLGYLFVVRDGRILAHTFPRGVPVELLEANEPASAEEGGQRRIASRQGEHFLDTAWPIFAGKAGVLRLGFSEALYRNQIFHLWVQIGGLTLVILGLALVGGLMFSRRLIRPLAALVAATREIDRGAVKVRVPVECRTELAQLASSFNHMVARQEDYNRRLEEQTQELERAYRQTQAACQIMREVSALGSLKEIGAFLLKNVREEVSCSHLALIALNGTRDTLFVVDSQGVNLVRHPQQVKTAAALLGKLTKPVSRAGQVVKPPLLPESFPPTEPQALIPFSDGHLKGVVVIACHGPCHCPPDKLSWLGLILTQNAGALGRAMLHEEEAARLLMRVEAAAGFGDLIGKDPKMQAIYRLIEDVAPTDATVLIQGESGTGKELVARAIHRLSPRRDKPFVVINCSAYPASLLESELFGHEKGAFTGATRQKPGRFELAQGGTVFLDEVGDIPPPAQIKLLRVLQNRRFERVGGEKTLTVDVRILAATHRDLLAAVAQGTFREDLLYRLKVIPIHLPPLRDRRNDIPLLALHFLRLFASQQGKTLHDLSPEAMRLLLEYSWPGNVRELENTLEHAVVLAKGSRLEPWDFPAALHQKESKTPPVSLADRELQTLLEILKETGGNKKLTAQRLGISRSTVYAMLKRYKASSSSDPTTH
uniref:HAMP domain-containing protein n=1 Tax=Desulfobacca acetoxidans TaxID=60893 RepID=A0A7V4LBY5_9BACT